MLANVKYAVGFLALLPACATVMYDGPTKPDHEVATIVAAGTRVTRIDARESSQEGGAFMVLPGTHVVAAYLKNAGRVSLLPQAVCFEAEKGRTYRTTTRDDGQQWELSIADDESSEPVAVRRVDFWAKDCAGAESFTPPPPSSTKLTLSPPPLLLAGSSEATAGDPIAPPAEAAPAAASVPTPAGAPDSAPAAAPGTAPAPAPAPAAAPALAPAGAVRGERPVARPMHRPGTGFGLETGVALGGDEIARGYFTDGSTETMHAGGGFVVALVGSWTPLWIRQAIGLGVATSIGYKHNTLDDDSGNALTLTRFPLAFSLQALVALQQHWYLLLRGGVQKELRVHYYGDGFAAPVNLFLTAPPGAFGEGGLLCHCSTYSSIGITVRYSAVHYEAGGESVDASNVAILGVVSLSL